MLLSVKLMPEMHLKQPGFTYSTCGLFTRNKERIEKSMQTGNTDFIYRSELDKTCFQHDMASGKSKDLTKRTRSDKVLRDKAFKITSAPKYDGYQRGLPSKEDLLKKKVFKHMTAVLKNAYFDVLDNIVNKYNNSSQNNKNETTN